MPAPEDRLMDEQAGPLVRPYAITNGRTRPTGEPLDLLALVRPVPGSVAAPASLEREHLLVLRHCQHPTSVADVASDLDLPLGVVRILLADLRDQRLVVIHRPPQAQPTDARLLQKVLDGLRRL